MSIERVSPSINTHGDEAIGCLLRWLRQRDPPIIVYWVEIFNQFKFLKIPHPQKKKGIFTSTHRGKVVLLQ